MSKKTELEKALACLQRACPTPFTPGMKAALFQIVEAASQEGYLKARAETIQKRVSSRAAVSQGLLVAERRLLSEVRRVRLGVNAARAAGFPLHGIEAADDALLEVQTTMGQVAAPIVVGTVWRNKRTRNCVSISNVNDGQVELTDGKKSWKAKTESFLKAYSRHWKVERLTRTVEYRKEEAHG